MAKKKETQVQTESPPDAVLQDAAQATETPPEPHPQPPGPQNGQGRGNAARAPVVTYSLQPDRTTRIDLEMYVTPYVTEKGEGFEQVTTTVNRFALGNDGSWSRQNVWRTHDLPCLLFLLGKAHAWALDRRTLDSSLPF